MTTTNSRQDILTYKRDSKPTPMHFSPSPVCVPAFGHCDYEVVTITSGQLKGRRAIITWGLNLPVSAIRESSFGLNQYQAVRNEAPESAQDVCELLVATGHD